MLYGIIVSLNRLVGGQWEMFGGRGTFQETRFVKESITCDVGSRAGMNMRIIAML